MKAMTVKPRTLDADDFGPVTSAAAYLMTRFGGPDGEPPETEAVMSEGAALVSALMGLATSDEQRKAMAGMILEVTTVAVEMGDELDEFADIFGDTQQTHLM